MSNSSYKLRAAAAAGGNASLVGSEDFCYTVGKMRCLRLLVAALALSGVGGLHAAAHVLDKDHAHVHDEQLAHSHGHEADHHDYDLDAAPGADVRLLPARAVLPTRTDATVAFDASPARCGRPFQIPKNTFSRGGAPPGRRVPPLSSRAPPA